MDSRNQQNRTAFSLRFMGSKKACDILLIPVILFTLLTKKVISQFQSLLFVCVFETRHDNEFDLEQLNNRIDCFMYKWKKKKNIRLLFCSNWARRGSCPPRIILAVLIFQTCLLKIQDNHVHLFETRFSCIGLVLKQIS